MMRNTVAHNSAPHPRLQEFFTLLSLAFPVSTHQLSIVQAASHHGKKAIASAVQGGTTPRRALLGDSCPETLMHTVSSSDAGCAAETNRGTVATGSTGKEQYEFDARRGQTLPRMSAAHAAMAAQRQEAARPASAPEQWQHMMMIERLPAQVRQQLFRVL
jgi:hypothetical protein